MLTREQAGALLDALRALSLAPPTMERSAAEQRIISALHAGGWSTSGVRIRP